MMALRLPRLLLQLRLPVHHDVMRAHSNAWQQNSSPCGSRKTSVDLRWIEQQAKHDADCTLPAWSRSGALRTLAAFASGLTAVTGAHWHCPQLRIVDHEPKELMLSAALTSMVIVPSTVRR